MSFGLRFSLVCVLVTGTIAAAGTTAQAATCDGTWSWVYSPSVSSAGNSLSAVSAQSPTEGWAVGSYTDLITQLQQPLAEHWNGTGWSAVKAPNVGTGYNYLSGVVTNSSTDAWAVGAYTSPTAISTLAEHWDGRRWSVISSPNVGRLNNSLSGVSADSPTDVWAVGFFVNSSGLGRTLAMHWDGRRWSIRSTPNVGAGGSLLTNVFVRSPSDVWAVGYWIDAAYNHTLILHWDGASWSLVSSPDPAGTNNNLQVRGVSATSATDAWAVGGYSDSNNIGRTLIEHWNGSAWSIVPGPDPGSVTNFLSGVSATSGTGAWAVGYWGNNFTPLTLILHWDGSTWAQVTSPNPGTSNNLLLAVSADSATDALAVGTYNPGFLDRTLTERYCSQARGSTGEGALP